jgi:hypothetical protein
LHVTLAVDFLDVEPSSWPLLSECLDLRAVKSCTPPRRPGFGNPPNQCAIWGDPGERDGGIEIEIGSEIELDLVDI